MSRFFTTSIISFFLLLLPIPLLANTQLTRGSFFIVSTSLAFEKPTNQSKSIRLHKGYAYTVLDASYNRKEQKTYFLIETNYQKKEKKEGFIYETSLNLQTKKQVNVYSILSATDNIPVQFIARIPIASLYFLGETKTIKSTPFITWQKVSFSDSIKQNYWISEQAGQYRIDKTKTELASIYQKARHAGIYHHFLKNALSGTVAIGNSMRFTLITLGTPNSISKLSNGEIRWDYDTQNLVFKHKRIVEIL